MRWFEIKVRFRLGFDENDMPRLAPRPFLTAVSHAVAAFLGAQEVAELTLDWDEVK